MSSVKIRSKSALDAYAPEFTISLVVALAILTPL
jgi:hypothetical protein